MSTSSLRKVGRCALAGGMIVGLASLCGLLKVACDRSNPLAAWERLHAAMEPTKRTGKTIVVQLERFRSEHGNYPESLDALVPDYLPAIPRPTDGEGFFYELDQGGYLLTFGFWFAPGIDLYPRCSWDSRDSDWHFEG